jgi:phosphopantothenoylcysteine synthetase/decarboxylase
MSNSVPKANILFKMSASIACVKAVGAISTLAKEGYPIRVACTPNVFNFIGRATLEGISHHPVYDNTYAAGHVLDHINLSRWADLTILCPATANTINKLAAGIGDNPVTNLFLAHDLGRKPYLIAPAMNGQMYTHPSVRASLKQLREWGCQIIDPEIGRMACGSMEQGRLAEEPRILAEIRRHLEPTTIAMSLEEGYRA